MTVIACASRLMCSVADDGMRRIHPTREADRYLEIGAPYVKVSGVWQKVTFSNVVRTKNLLAWTRPQANLAIWHGGHFVKLAIELKNGYVPEDGLIAFPVGLMGLTRSGANILADGVPVSRLRVPVAYDADNETDTRPIGWQFITLNSQPYLVLTLPSLAGMSRPVIDPTLELQPDPTAGLDVRLREDQPTTNYGTHTSLIVGFSPGTYFRYRTLIKFDLSSLPDDATVTSATLSLYMYSESSTNNESLYVYRQKRAWVESQATWNSYATGSSWAVAGGFGADDCEQSYIGSLALSATESAGWKNVSLTPTTKAGLDLGNGWLLKMSGEANSSEYDFYSSDYTTDTSLRPKLVVEYTEGGATEYTQNVSGALTPIGIVMRKTTTSKAGAVMPSGALFRLITTVKVGILTPSGAITRQAGKRTVGAITPSSGQTRQTATAKSGALTPSGSMTRRTTKTAFTSSLTPSGVLQTVKAFLQLVAGALTPSGVLTRQTGKSLAGAVSPSGMVSKSITKVILDSLTPIGSLARRIATMLAGALTPSGALSATKAFLRLITGTLTPLGSLSRRTGKTPSGTLTPTTTLTRSIGKSVSGTFVPVGSLTRHVAKTITGSAAFAGALAATRAFLQLVSGALSLSGSLRPRANKVVSGDITPSGTIARQTRKAIAGALAPVGSLTHRIAKTIAGALTASGTASGLIAGLVHKVYALVGSWHITRAIVGYWHITLVIMGYWQTHHDLDGEV